MLNKVLKVAWILGLILSVLAMYNLDINNLSIKHNQSPLIIFVVSIAVALISYFLMLKYRKKGGVEPYSSEESKNE